MNLYLYRLSQTERDDCDTYDSMVVAAESEEEARKIHPRGKWADESEWSSRCWASSPDSVKVEIIGEAKLSMQKGVVLASFNAG